ncbi:RHE_PE00001 family protein [Mesorhizobium sp. M0012]|uniref:RHE_PE00001 family protein n=1 Tax=Mesorhizobium sp. M0012 TaxID=2956840 RepID=UPI003336F27D
MPDYEAALVGPVARATEALARLDERLARSPVREGFIERQHFADAAAALWLEGELVISRTSSCTTPTWRFASRPTSSPARMPSCASAGTDVPARTPRSDERPDLIYDLDWNEEERLTEWQTVFADTREWPLVMRAAILLDAWSDIEVLQHGIWLGQLLVAALLRQEGISANHLASLHLGAKNIPRERRRARNRSDRLLASLDGIHEAALVGLKEHDRLVMAKSQMERRLKQRRTSSKLADLVEFVLSRPIVSTGMIQEVLKVSKQGALNLVGELGLREMTGRGRFRAWGIV